MDKHTMQGMVGLLYEAGQLKRVKRSGWWSALIDDPESVAEHSFRTAVVAFVLASVEGLDANKMAAAALFHDFAETRINDVHKMAARYLTAKKEAERKIFSEQRSGLPFDLEIKLNKKEADVLGDADALEMALQAREYAEAGHPLAEKWLESAEKKLRTANSKLLFVELKKQRPSQWWESLDGRDAK